MNKVDSFKELEVYQLAFKVQQEIFLATQHWPSKEDYSLTDQIRRSSRSIGANLAESWAKRRYPAHFLSKLTDADGELQETFHWISSRPGRGYTPGVKRTLVIAIAALLAVASAQAQASGTATKPRTAESPPKQLALPPEQNIGETVGRGDPLVLRLRLSGRQEETEVTFLVDTGSHVTILDRSFERLLGSRLGKQRLKRVFAGRGVEQANAYTAPRLYLGNVQLLTGPTVLTCDLAHASGNN